MRGEYGCEIPRLLSTTFFRMNQIPQAKDDLAAKGRLVLLGLTSGLHTAGMRRRHIPAISSVRVQP